MLLFDKVSFFSLVFKIVCTILPLNKAKLNNIQSNVKSGNGNKPLKKADRLKINMPLGDLLKISVSGNPKPKRKKPVKK